MGKGRDIAVTIGASFLFYNSTSITALPTCCSHGIPSAANHARPSIFPSMLPLFFSVVMPPLRNHQGVYAEQVHDREWSRPNWKCEYTWVLAIDLEKGFP
jgi:hypothetical protein